MSLFAFDLYRLHDVFGGKLAKLNLRSSVAQSVGVAKAFGGLISQIGGAFGHAPVWHVDQRSDV
jgi:hypothetical protein